MPRKFPRPIRRVVIKIGSSLIASYRLKPRRAWLRSLVAQMSALRSRNIEVVLVSSGAIVLGMGELQLKARPNELAGLQALAAVGQTTLMHTYSVLFKKFGLSCAQLLLTWDDFTARNRYNNASKTLKTLLERHVIPVINENDTISTDEIKFGDNDRLSALVASMLHADLLVILSDVEGLFDTPGADGKVFREIKEITREIEGVAGGTAKRHVARGGMSAKLEAIKVATHARIPCVIADGKTEDVLARILAGERIGTFFFEKEEKLLARKHWISFGAQAKGRLHVDAGAAGALLEGGKSLLLPGVVRHDGHFKADDVVVICDPDGHEIARGVSEYSAVDLQAAVTDQPELRRGKREVVHCNNLVLCRRD